MPIARPLTAIVCEADNWTREILTREVERTGFEVLGVSATVIDALNQFRAARPSFVVMGNEHAGMSGMAAMPELREGDDPPEVLLIASDGSVRDRAKDEGAYEVAIRGDIDMLERMLQEVRHLLETGERRKAGGDRRTNPERRVKQDWSRVTTERRSGSDRRRGPRREDEVAVAPVPEPSPAERRTAVRIAALRSRPHLPS